MGAPVVPSPFDPTPPDHGPFAPPDDLDPDEYLRWLQAVMDVQTVRTGFLLSMRSTKKGQKPKNLELLSALEAQIDAALDRLSQSDKFLAEMGRRIGEEGFGKVLAGVDLKNKEALDGLREKADKEGGLVPYLEKQSVEFPGVFSAQRPRMKAAFDSILNGDPKDSGQPEPAADAHSLIECATGAAEVYVGAGAAFYGGEAILIGGVAALGTGAAGVGVAFTGLVVAEMGSDLVHSGLGHIHHAC